MTDETEQTYLPDGAYYLVPGIGEWLHLQLSDELIDNYIEISKAEDNERIPEVARPHMVIARTIEELILAGTGEIEVIPFEVIDEIVVTYDNDETIRLLHHTESQINAHASMFGHYPTNFLSAGQFSRLTTWNPEDHTIVSYYGF